MPKYDFCGWATKSNILCSDGRIIGNRAFEHCDGTIVPLVWNHGHKDMRDIIGHALLENRDEGVYAYCSLNDTEYGKNAKSLINHGDVRALSIYANKLRQNGPTVVHGDIKEVSLVMAGANPGAYIESVIEHGEALDDEFIFSPGEEIELYHSEDYDDEEGDEDMFDEEEFDEEFDEEELDEDRTIGDVIDEMTDEQVEVLSYLVGSASEGEEMSHADDLEEDFVFDGSERTIGDVLDEMDDEQLDVLEYLMTSAATEAEFAHSDMEEGDEEDMFDDEERTIGDVINEMDDEQLDVLTYLVGDALEEGEEMGHNLFENEDYDTDTVLCHSDLEEIANNARSVGSLREAFNNFCEDNDLDAGSLMHADGDYGIQNIDYLFPEARSINTIPQFISRDMGWVNGVMAEVHKTPFARVKSIDAKITEDEARAKGYLKGKLKKEEVFSLLKRTTDPQTIYKKQKFDRDDIVDITDFDVIAWVKSEMRMMLNEEIARAILIGDGRLNSSDDKIAEDHIRPIAYDAELYTIQSEITVPAGGNKYSEFIDQCVRSKIDYKGTGSPTLYTTEAVVTECLLLKDNMGHRLYKTEADLAMAMRVSKIVTVPVMVNAKAKDPTKDLLGIIVNLTDYNVGTNKGGATSFFDDFDIDFNQYKYLIETRLSGALIKPYSAIALIN